MLEFLVEAMIRISTSISTSALALSLIRMSFSAMATLSAVSRRVIELSCSLVDSRRASINDRSSLSMSLTSALERKKGLMTRSSYSRRFCGVSSAMMIERSSSTL